MSEQRATAHALALMQQHGLNDWQFQLDHARQRCGSCNYSRRKITVSRHLLQHNAPEEITATILHEIAHALVGPGHGHGPRWQAMARSIGAEPQATNDRAEMPAPRWALQCTACNSIVARRHRRRMNTALYRCGYCRSAAASLQWIKA